MRPTHAVEPAEEPCKGRAQDRQHTLMAPFAITLARFFGTSERFWINLQARYDLETEKDRLGDALDGIRPLSAAS